MKRQEEEKKPDVIEDSETDVLCKVALTQDELLAAGQQLGDQYAKMGELEKELEEFKGQHKGKVGEVEAKVARLSSLVSKRYDYRNVRCTVRKNFTTGTFRVVREDTGEIVEDRRMTSDECQRGLALFNQKQEQEANKED